MIGIVISNSFTSTTVSAYVTQASFSPFLTSRTPLSPIMVFNFSIFIFCRNCSIVEQPTSIWNWSNGIIMNFKVVFHTSYLLPFVVQNFKTILCYRTATISSSYFFCRRSLSHLYKNILLIEVSVFKKFPYQLFLDQECPQCCWQTYTYNTWHIISK